MATNRLDLFNDDLVALLAKYGIEKPEPDHSPMSIAYYNLLDEVERALDAQGPALTCDHCGGKFTRLELVRERGGNLLTCCSLCRDGVLMARRG